MIRRNATIGQPRDGMDRFAWCVAALVSLSLVGLVHDLQNVSAFGAEATEAGGSTEAQADFQHNSAAAKPHRKFGFVGLLSAGMICLLTAPRHARIQPNAIALLAAACLLWALASAAWSVDRQQTLRELVRLIAFVFVGAALAWRFTPRALCQVLTAALAGSVAISVGVELITGGFRPWAAGYRLSGSMHSNGLGAQAMLVAVAAYCFARQSRRRAFWWALFVAAATVVVLSKSRTSFATGAIALFAIELLTRPWRRTALAAASLVSLAAIAVLTASALGLFDERSLGRIAAFGRVESTHDLTGRLPLWQALWHDASGRRLEGFGYGAFWTTARIESLHSGLGWYAHHAHSAIFETLLNVGLVGLALVLAIAALSLQRITAWIRADGAAEYCVLGAWLIAALVNGIAEAGFVTPRDLGLVSAAVVFCAARLPAVTSAGANAVQRRPAVIRSRRGLASAGTGGASHE